MKNIRLISIAVFFLLIFTVILVRLFYWQIIKGNELFAASENQHFITLALPAERGEILSSDKSPLVTNQTVYEMYVDLRNIEGGKNNLIDKVSRLMINQNLIKSQVNTLNKEKEKLKLLLNQKNVVWVPLAHKISPKRKEEIEKLKIKGLGFEKEEIRFYPEGSISAQLLGFVGKDINGEDKGYFGLEGNYDLQLKGKPGRLMTEKDALGRPILLGKEEKIKASEGRTLITTINKSIQKIAEKYLREGMINWGARKGDVIVMDPKNGAILAMVSFPAYDPAKYEESETNFYKNPVTTDMFEPGSIMKPIIMSMALEKGKVTPDTRCPKCFGPREIGGYLIRTFNDVYHPNLTMREVLINSDNTGMVYVGEQLESSLMDAYFKNYGFGSLSGIDVEEEAEGELKPQDKWYAIDKATLTFGQGIAVTPIQMIRAFSVFANGGYLVKPYIVEDVIDNGKIINVAPSDKKNIITLKTCKTITDMLVSVNDKSPLHFPKDLIPELKNYKIAAKSGTAQIPIAGHYDPNKTIGSVIGYAPADNPAFIILVRLVEPTVRPWGSDTAGPIFYKITKDLLMYYGISPS